MRRRLLASFILFAVVAMVLLVIPVGYTLDSNANSSTLFALRRDTGALAAVLSNYLNRNRLASAIKFSETYSHVTRRQILLVQGTRTLIASKHSQADDEEIAQLAHRVASTPLSGVIPRSSLEGAQYYVAMRLPQNTSDATRINRAVLIVTFPVTIVTRAVHGNWRNLALYGLVMLLAAVGFGFLISTSLTRPLRRIGRAVEEIGRGELRIRAPVDEGPPELRRLAEAINAMSARLVDLLQAQTTFVEDASHQLRTPLTALQLHLENLQYGGESGPQDFIPVLSELSRLRRLVESLLELARNETRPAILSIIDLAAIARARVDYWRPLAGEHGIALDASGERELAALAIEGVMEQVIDNLLANSFDATPSGGRIIVETRIAEGHVELRVIDNGVGMSAANRRLALRRFWRARDNTAEGSGLGLAIAEQLVRLSGGSIELREAPGGGVDATVVLRRANPNIGVNVDIASAH